MLSRLAMLTPAFLALQAGGVYWIAGLEHPPAAPALTAFPVALGDWKKAGENPIDPDTAAQLRADRTLNWTYLGAAGTLQADLFVPTALAPTAPTFRRWRTTVTVQDIQSTAGSQW